MFYVIHYCDAAQYQGLWVLDRSLYALKPVRNTSSGESVTDEITIGVVSFLRQGARQRRWGVTQVILRSKTSRTLELPRVKLSP
jgi:hypothetical protein